ncbi:uncharacterized protein LOC110853451 [Folsomia candida]|uniref:Lithostathine-2 n=1 Tax=Folsomia candida TaxID=158441 RepID=A0A226DZX6_FOLCA|nr:uncharacterized protein LOC110853451 [Folsomia candida]OXA50769.1 Lithostathine-2 [Folsomia candida]
MSVKSNLFCILTFSWIITILSASSLREELPFKQNNITEFDGFSYLGSFQVKQGQPRWTYFISKDEIPISEAYGRCLTMFNGQLLTIFTKEEDEYVRLRIQIDGIGADPTAVVATAGKWNPVSSPPRWEWTSTGGPFIYANFRGGTTPPGTAGQCVVVSGELSNFGWSNVDCGDQAYYICQF